MVSKLLVVNLQPQTTRIMTVDTEKLVRVKTYADEAGVSTTWIYKQADKGEIKIIEIDGVKFVKVQ